MTADAGWWDGYFDRHFLELYEPLLPPDETLGEVDALLTLLDAPPGARVLDLGCGWGRHAVELARAGLRVTGLDASPVLLDEAAARARAAGVELELRRGDMRRLDAAGEYDAVLSLFSSLGYFPDERDDLRVLRAVRRALRPGGTFILDVTHRDLVAREYSERDWWRGPAGELVWVERDFDAVAGVSREWLRWRGPDGEGEKYHEIRIRAATEWRALLEEAELWPVEWLGGWELEPFDRTSERLVVVARAGERSASG